MEPNNELTQLQIQSLGIDIPNKARELTIKNDDIRYKRIELYFIKIPGTICTIAAIIFAGFQIRILNRQMDNNEKASQNLQQREIEVRLVDKATRRNELLSKLYTFDDAIHKDLLNSDPIVTKLLFHDDSGNLYHTIRKDFNSASAPGSFLLPRPQETERLSQLQNATSYARMYSYCSRFGDMFEFFLMLSLDENNPIEKTLKTSWVRYIDDKCKESYGFVHFMYETKNGWSEELVSKYLEKHFTRLTKEDKDMIDKK